MKNRHLKGIGEYDYDYRNDIAFFKTKNRDYKKSIEANNLVIDIDKENYVTGLQIMNASRFLRVDRKHLRKCPAWKFEAKLENNKIEIRLQFAIKLRNQIKEVNPIIMEQLPGRYKDSKVLAEPILCNR